MTVRTAHVATSLFIVRHGQSTWNAVHRWQGRANPPLSELGEAQSRSACSALASLGPLDAVVTSSLHRARRTGEILAEGQSIPLAAAMDDLAERSAGMWEGLTRPEIENRFPGYLAAGNYPAGYEEEASVVCRALSAIASLADEHPGRRLLVVSHGGVIEALERSTNAREVVRRRLDNLEGRWFVHRFDVLASGPRRIHLLDSATAAPSDQRSPPDLGHTSDPSPTQ
jgi:probable phosphoglycerate mutase